MKWWKFLNAVTLLTVASQKRDLTPGEYLLHWKQVVSKLLKIQKLLTTFLSNSLNLRQKRLLMNEAFVTSVWMCLVSFCLYKRIL